MFKKINKKLFVFAVLSLYVNSALIVKAQTILDSHKEKLHTFVFTGDMFLGQDRKSVV